MGPLATHILEVSAEIRKQWMSKWPSSSSSPPHDSIKDSVLSFFHAVDWTVFVLLSFLFFLVVCLVYFLYIAGPFLLSDLCMCMLHVQCAAKMHRI
jgi:hypothetical protein